jgi:hypothetical protein
VVFKREANFRSDKLEYLSASGRHARY